jgi:hypothetical protein
MNNLERLPLTCSRQSGAPVALITPADLAGGIQSATEGELLSDTPPKPLKLHRSERLKMNQWLVVTARCAEGKKRHVFAHPAKIEVVIRRHTAACQGI